MSAASLNRKLHRWGALLTAVPLLVIILTGAVLQLKKDWGWVQPATMRSADPALELGWEDVLAATRSVQEAEVSSWEDIDRLDVRPDRGLIKVRCNNRWEVQLDAKSGEVLSSHYRRSDLIEQLHDGSWFHPNIKLWVFLPTAVILFCLWITGSYLWLLPHLIKRRRKQKKAQL